MKKHIAFTLAETLLVIGIIGVVSALTLPNLNSSTGNKEKVAQVKKIYQNLNDAYGRAIAKYGPVGTWFINDANDTAKAKRVGERITEFMKLSKDCAMNASQGCIQDTSDDSKTSAYKVITADGTSIMFGISDGEPDIYVDIDGPTKGTYTNGKDRFIFDINASKGLITNGYNETFANLLANVKDTGARDMASTWIIKYDNMDYLNLNSSAQCKNNTSLTPTEANPRCK